MKLMLYYKQGCPYCEKVFVYIKKLKLSFPEKNIDLSDEAKDELISLGGKSQVPCLTIDENPMYESDEIINWISDNINDLK